MTTPLRAHRSIRIDRIERSNHTVFGFLRYVPMIDKSINGNLRRQIHDAAIMVRMKVCD